MSGECDKFVDLKMSKKMLCDIPIKDTRKLNISFSDLFERDLKKVLETLEKLCQGSCDHIDYVKAYKYFVDAWSPVFEEEVVFCEKCKNEFVACVCMEIDNER